MSCPLVTATAEWYKSSDVPLIRPSIHTMPASDNSTQRTQALALLKRQGMTRLAEFSEAGITATTVGRMERAGEVVRLARGLYQLPDAALDAQQSLAEAARLVAVVVMPRFLGRNRLIRHPHLRLVVDDSLAICRSAYVNRDQAVVLKCWAEFEGQVIE